MTPIIGDLLQNTVGKVVDKLTDKFLPPSMSEKEKEEFKMKAREIGMEESKTLVEFVKATEPDAQYTGRWMNNLRASVRPGVAWLAFLTYQGSLMYLTYIGQMTVQEFVAQAGALSTMAIGFYFGQRHT